MSRSNAKSLVYECILAVFTSFREFDRAVRAAADKLKDEFLSSEDDPNLRYLGLRALSVLGEGHPWAVESNREAVVRSLTDPDMNIRHEALNLVMGTVFDSNVVEITLLLVGYALRSDPEFANKIIEAILRVCSRNYYEIVEDFNWYVDVLGDLARNPHCEKGEEIERQMVDIGLRVRDARPELVRVARDLLIDPALLGNHFIDRVLSAAAWVSGEYVEFSKNPLELLAALLQPKTSLLSSSARAVYVQAVLKVIVFYFDSYIEQIGPDANADGSENNNGVESDYGASTSLQQEMSKKPFAHESIVFILNLVEQSVGPLTECHEVEVQERARNVIGLIHLLKQSRDWGKEEEGLRNDSRIQEIVKLMKGAFSEELGPVSVQAQQKVPVPEGLILKENLADLAAILGKDDIVQTSSTLFSLGSHHSREIKEESEPGTESTSLLAEHRKRHGLYYLDPEKDGAELNDYPKANDPLLSLSQGDAADELLKLTEKSLIPRKAKSMKPRPVVVKLDEGDSILADSKPVLESKDDILSGAIREVLLGSEGSKPASSQNIASEKSSTRKSKDVPVNSGTISQPKENLGEIEQGSSSSRRSRHHRHGKDRHQSHRENKDKEGTTHKSSQRDSHHYGKHKHRQRADVPLAVVPQAPVIQDFLL
ncbi:AP-3 complex subunit delta [Iris pallida]|uniref:AP-3 complex subunit delta n=1 Tax=Iris pallida TaxID=29817 RepID=A0AAX6HER6_IRIPA|nr:AP-3 complex subunit delta [Iris pallida]